MTQPEIWTFENIREAKELVKTIAALGRHGGTLTPRDATNIVTIARAIIQRVNTNNPAGAHAGAIRRS